MPADLTIFDFAYARVTAGDNIASLSVGWNVSRFQVEGAVVAAFELPPNTSSVFTWSSGLLRLNGVDTVLTEHAAGVSWSKITGFALRVDIDDEGAAEGDPVALEFELGSLGSSGDPQTYPADGRCGQFHPMGQTPAGCSVTVFNPPASNLTAVLLIFGTPS